MSFWSYLAYNAGLMDSHVIPLANSVRGELLHQEGVTRFTPNRRFAKVFVETQPAETVLWVESGLVKLFKRGSEGKEIILDIVGQGNFFGEQAVLVNASRKVNAEILTEGLLYVVPRQLFLNFMDGKPDLWRQFAEQLLVSKCNLQKKVELLCLNDVEHRILHYLHDLATTFGSRLNPNEAVVGLSQGELASLIGATRETTSTTLNALARRGLIKLGRRQMIVVSGSDGRAEAKTAS